MISPVVLTLESEEGVVVAQEGGGLVHGPEHSGISINRLHQS